MTHPRKRRLVAAVGCAVGTDGEVVVVLGDEVDEAVIDPRLELRQGTDGLWAVEHAGRALHGGAIDEVAAGRLDHRREAVGTPLTGAVMPLDVEGTVGAVAGRLQIAQDLVELLARPGIVDAGGNAGADVLEHGLVGPDAHAGFEAAERVQLTVVGALLDDRPEEVAQLLLVGTAGDGAQQPVEGERVQGRAVHVDEVRHLAGRRGTGDGGLVSLLADGDDVDADPELSSRACVEGLDGRHLRTGVGARVHRHVERHRALDDAVADVWVALGRHRGRGEGGADQRGGGQQGHLATGSGMNHVLPPCPVLAMGDRRGAQAITLSPALDGTTLPSRCWAVRPSHGPPADTPSAVVVARRPHR